MLEQRGVDRMNRIIYRVRFAPSYVGVRPDHGIDRYEIAADRSEHRVRYCGGKQVRLLMINPGPEQSPDKCENHKRWIRNVHCGKSDCTGEYREEVVGREGFSEASKKEYQYDVLLQQRPKRILNEPHPEDALAKKLKIHRIK